MGNAVKLMGCAHELGPDGVTQRNMMVALSAVEQQCTRLLQQYTREQKPKPPPPMRELPPGVAVTIEVLNPLKVSRGRQSIATPQAARGWAHPSCRHFKNQSCC
jgi:hypothetical protein